MKQPEGDPQLNKIILLLVLLLAFAIPANASIHTPDRLLRLDYVEQQAGFGDATALYAVVNTSFSPQTVTAVLHRKVEDGTLERAVEYEHQIPAKGVWTVNLRDIIVPAGIDVDSDNVFRGRVDLYGSEAVFIGDYFQVYPKEGFAVGKQLRAMQASHCGPCDTIGVRFMNEGTWEAGTLLTIAQEIAHGSTSPVRINAWSETGESLGSFSLEDWNSVGQIDVVSMGLDDPFGWFEIQLSQPGTVLGLYRGEGQYNAGVEGWCVEDRYTPPPQCEGASLALSNDRNGYVGEKFFTRIYAFGTGDVDVSVSGLTEGMQYDPVNRTITGTPTEEGDIVIEASNRCGIDQLVIPIRSKPGDELNCSIVLNPRTIMTGQDVAVEWQSSGATAWTMTPVPSGFHGSPSKGVGVIENVQVTTEVVYTVSNSSNEVVSCKDTVVVEEPPVQCIPLDFEGLPAGTTVKNQYSGVAISAIPEHFLKPMIYDAESISCGDQDLFWPGLGGVLILSDGSGCQPNDYKNGGGFRFDFDKKSSIGEVRLLDIDSDESARAILYDESGVIIRDVTVSGAGDHTQQSLVLDGEGSTLIVSMTGSGAVASVGCQ